MTDLDILVRVKELYKDNCHSTDISTFLLEQKCYHLFSKLNDYKTKTNIVENFLNINSIKEQYKELSGILQNV